VPDYKGCACNGVSVRGVDLARLGKGMSVLGGRDAGDAPKFNCPHQQSFRTVAHRVME
jgi:hypothetical protein